MAQTDCGSCCSATLTDGDSRFRDAWQADLGRTTPPTPIFLEGAGVLTAAVLSGIFFERPEFFGRIERRSAESGAAQGGLRARAARIVIGKVCAG